MLETRTSWSVFVAAMISVVCYAGLGAAEANRELTLNAACLARVPQGVRVGAGVEAVKIGERDAIRFRHEGITFPLAGTLAAESGTATMRFRMPDDWPSSERGTLLHVGEKSHVHVTLLVNNSRLIAVYKAGEESYAAISCDAASEWGAGTWHEAVFSWRATGDAVDFYLETDAALAGRQTGRLIDQWPADGYVGARRQGQPWKGAIESVRLSSTFELPRELRPGRRKIVVDGNQLVGQCYNFWSINNYTSQHMFADPGYAVSAKRDKPFMKYVNCVRLMGGRHDGRNKWYNGVDAQGKVKCDFSGMVQYLRGIRAAGYAPRIVLDNVPTTMSAPGELAKYGNTRPARDLKVWHQYVRSAVRAMVDAFGAEEVGRWRFRVGTEPDLDPGHWQGTKEEYLHHYDCTVDAVCSVIPDAEIGPGNILNPAHANRVNAAGKKAWGLDIVDHCAIGMNTWTGKVGTRMRFLECSWYGGVGRSIDSLDLAIAKMRSRLARYPELAQLPISIAEFAVLQDEYQHRLFGGDITQWSASWYAAVADRIYALNVQQVHEWSQATRGILHPRTYVIGMLELMKDGHRLEVSVDGESAARAGAISCVKGGRYYILLYNHRPWRTPAIPERIDLTLDAAALQGGEWSVSEWGIDEDHGVFVYQLYADCEEAGIEPLPDSPVFGGNLGLRFGREINAIFLENQAKYAQLSLPAVLRKDEPLKVAGNSAKITIELPGHSVRLLIISRR